jgi:hypothetical protein
MKKLFHRRKAECKYLQIIANQLENDKNEEKLSHNDIKNIEEFKKLHFLRIVYFFTFTLRRFIFRIE